MHTLIIRLHVTQLLTRDPSKRLGSSKQDALEVQKHPFFAPLDWDRIMRREVRHLFIKGFIKGFLKDLLREGGLTK